MTEKEQKEALLSVFSNRMQSEMDRKGLSQKQLSEETNIPSANLNGYLRGRNKGKITEPGIFNLLKLSQRFGVSADYLLGLTDIKAPDPEKTIMTVFEYTGLSEEASAVLHQQREKAKTAGLQGLLPYLNGIITSTQFINMLVAVSLLPGKYIKAIADYRKGRDLARIECNLGDPYYKASYFLRKCIEEMLSDEITQFEDEKKKGVDQ